MIYLYHFSHYSKPRDGQLLAEWRHTSYERPLMFDAYPGRTWTPLPALTHAEIRYDSEKSAGQTKVTVPRDFDVALMFLAGYPYGAIYLRIIEVEGDTPDAMAQVIWRGRVRNCSHNGLTAELSGTDGRERLQRLGLRLNGGASCQWSLYGPECGVNQAAYTRSGKVLAISPDGLDITTDLSEADNWFKAGLFRTRFQARMVLRNAGGVLTLMSPIAGLTVGDVIQAAKGCDRTSDATHGCKSFNNYNNFSGFEGFDAANVFSEGAS